MAEERLPNASSTLYDHRSSQRGVSLDSPREGGAGGGGDSRI